MIGEAETALVRLDDRRPGLLAISPSSASPGHSRIMRNYTSGKDSQDILFASGAGHISTQPVRQ